MLLMQADKTSHNLMH